MSAKHTPKSRDCFTPSLDRAAKIIKDAIVLHCGTGADLDNVCADAAKQILGEIADVAVHRFTNFEPGPWKRMPPELRAAIFKATGGSA